MTLSPKLNVLPAPQWALWKELKAIPVFADYRFSRLNSAFNSLEMLFCFRFHKFFSSTAPIEQGCACTVR